MLGMIFGDTEISYISATRIKLNIPDIVATKITCTRENVNTNITDGRNYLLLRDQKYDLVSMEISSIWFAGAASYKRKLLLLKKPLAIPLVKIF